MSIKGTPLDPNFGYHGPDDYMRMLGEGQAANAYVDKESDSEQQTQHPLNLFNPVAPATLGHTAPTEAQEMPTDIFTDLVDDYPDAQNILQDNALYDLTHGILPDESRTHYINFTEREISDALRTNPLDSPYTDDSWMYPLETHDQAQSLVLNGVAVPRTNPASGKAGSA